MKNNNNIPSVGKIIFWMLVFYPLGFYFLFKRIKEKNLQEVYSNMYNSNRAPVSKNVYIYGMGARKGEYDSRQTAQPEDNSLLGRQYRAISIAELAGGVLFAMNGLGNLLTGSDLSSGLVSIGVSLILIWLGYKRSLKITKYQPYLNYLASYDSAYLSDIARYVCKDENTVRSDLTDMIGCKMLNAKIAPDGQVILAGAADGTGSAAGSTVRSAKKTVTCPHCGAPTTVITGKRNTCEYCGLSVEG